MNRPSPEPTRILLLREMAAGPMSAVFVGEMPTRTGPRRLAIKLLRELPDGGVERLLDVRDRARRLAELGHRHHAPTLDVARVDERFALIAPYIDGIDLLDWMDVLAETGRVLPRRVTCEILRGTALALEAASHWQLPSEGQPCDVIHRDLKPSNILIARDGSLRVTDFGTGYTALAGRAARSGALKKGLVRYLSPERREGRRASEAADIYALGVLAVELFRGRWLRRLRTRNPAHDRQLADVVARIDDLQMRSDSDDRGLRNLILRMVAFDEEARPDIQEVVGTFRTLSDRVEGPSLEAFAVAHAVPWLEETPRVPDERLRGAEAVVVERGQPLPPAGGGLPVVTLPDRYDLQLESSGDTGEWPMDEHTDPRLRNKNMPRRDPTDPQGSNTEPFARPGFARDGSAPGSIEGGADDPTESTTNPEDAPLPPTEYMPRPDPLEPAQSPTSERTDPRGPQARWSTERTDPERSSTQPFPRYPPRTSPASSTPAQAEPVQVGLLPNEPHGTGLRQSAEHRQRLTPLPAPDREASRDVALEEVFVDPSLAESPLPGPVDEPSDELDFPTEDVEPTQPVPAPVAPSDDDASDIVDLDHVAENTSSRSWVVVASVVGVLILLNLGLLVAILIFITLLSTS